MSHWTDWTPGSRQQMKELGLFLKESDGTWANGTTVVARDGRTVLRSERNPFRPGSFHTTPESAGLLMPPGCSVAVEGSYTKYAMLGFHSPSEQPGAAAWLGAVATVWQPGPVTWTPIYGSTFDMSHFTPVATPEAPEPQPKLPRRKQAEPYIGYKRIDLTAEKGDGALLVQGLWDVYPVDATALCLNGKRHKAPNERCTCGFYAMAEPLNYDWRFLAKVQLFGRVIRAEHGYRAERQRVLEIIANNECSICGYDEREAVGFQVSTTGAVHALCAGHSPMGAATIEQVSAAVGVPVKWWADPDTSYEPKGQCDS